MTIALECYEWMVTWKFESLGEEIHVRQNTEFRSVKILFLENKVVQVPSFTLTNILYQ